MKSIAFIALVGIVLVFIYTRRMGAGRRLRRKASLRQEGGLWLWTDLDGSARSSATHPEGPGGAWDDSGGDDGGDGGSDD